MTTYEQLEEINKKLDLLTGNGSNDDIVFNTISRSKFNKERWIFAFAAVFFFFITTLVAYWMKTLLFLVPFGFFVMSIGYLVMLIYDKFTTYNDTFESIEKSPVASSLLLLCLTLLFAVGVFVGQQYIPESFRGEAVESANSNIINQSTPQGNKGINTQTPGTNASEPGQDGTPNR